MSMSIEELTKLIQQTIPDAIVTITDLAGDGDHYQAEVKSSAFAGKSRIEQHKMVYAALGDKMGGQLHALSVVTKTI
jgi:stress-induced morphogen